MFEITYLELFLFITVTWIIVRVIYAVKNKKVSLTRELQLLLVYVCIIVIARIVYFPWHHENGHIGTMKFDSARVFPFWLNALPVVHMFDIYDGWKMNIIGNITMFIPVGIVWPICYKELNRIWKVVLAGFGFTLLIEITQLPFYGRCSDIDDIILNTSGVLIGSIIYFIIEKCISRNRV